METFIIDFFDFKDGSVSSWKIQGYGIDHVLGIVRQANNFDIVIINITRNLTELLNII